MRNSKAGTKERQPGASRFPALSFGKRKLPDETPGTGNSREKRLGRGREIDRGERVVYVIAGLGNPGARYENTRHNTGFDVLDILSRETGIPIVTKKYHALIGKGVIGGVKTVLVKPQTFMNLSGTSIREVLQYYDVPPERLIVICDDIHLDVGVLRIRKNGSAGGHNGLKHIIAELGSQEFMRIRVGAGKQPEEMDLISHVLSHYSKEEREELAPAEERAAKAALMLLSEPLEKVMNLYNGRGQEAGK